MAATILIVDDDETLQKWVAFELDRVGFQVITASTGPTGLDAARAEPKPDLILLDIDMPGMDGFQVATTLQQNPETTGIPIIFLTARVSLKDKMAGFEAGGVDYLTKPFEMPELIARVKATLHLSVIQREKARRDLEEYKSNLAENMSHELMTPVSKVLNGADILSRLAHKENISQFDEVIEIIRNGAGELRWLMEDLLLINQISDKAIGPFRQAVDLTQAVKFLVEQTEARYRRDKLEFEVYLPEACPVNIHRKHLNHILHHLLDNAGKFSPPGSRPKVTVRPVGQAGAEIEIQDSGQGIKSEFQEEVFDKFYQVDMSMTRENGGLGLGLYIARTLARTYGGDVTLTSQPGAGTTVQLAIPDEAADWA
ncbi:MAG: hybrid sensor histidine kinase/response regulator [Chloroflexota bacterium]|nr:MAG: hybrid sensor histidine kinase/response regulator [Chloroflexota bacterium]